jgi:hypothetical protein
MRTLNGVDGLRRCRGIGQLNGLFQYVHIILIENSRLKICSSDKHFCDTQNATGLQMTQKLPAQGSGSLLAAVYG